MQHLNVIQGTSCRWIVMFTLGPISTAECRRQTIDKVGQLYRSSDVGLKIPKIAYADLPSLPHQM